MNRRERLSIFARRKRHFRDKRNVASPRREVARRIPAIVMTGLQELQNEGNGLGLANTTAPRKALRRSRGRFSLLGSRRSVCGLDPNSSDRGVFSSSPGGQPMNISVLVVDDEPLARVGIKTRLSAYSDTLVVGDADYRTGLSARVDRVRTECSANSQLGGFRETQRSGVSGIFQGASYCAPKNSQGSS
jgi:hypothetical protein